MKIKEQTNQIKEQINQKKEQISSLFFSLKKNEKFKKFLPLIILAVGILGMGVFALSRPAPKKQVTEDRGALVEVMTVNKQDRPVVVHGTGTLQARQEVSITPQVSGQIKTISPNFVAGGFFRKGQLLFKIEDVDHKLDVDRARASLTKAEYELALVESQAKIARLEWERLKVQEEREVNPLALYEPQLKNARANAASARASLKQAQLDLERTRVYAPFNSRVRSEQVDLGQYIRAGTSIAVLAGTDTAEVVVPLPFEEMKWLNIPRPGMKQKGSPSTVHFRRGDDAYEWQGRIVRSLGEVDTRGRMARVVVSINDPYGLKKRKNQKERPPLEGGMFVDVSLHGTNLSGVYAIPRKALRDDDTIWIMDDQNLLRIHPVQVVRLEKNDALITNGIEDGTLVVLTTVSGAADGMKLRPRTPEAGSQIAEQGSTETAP